MTAENQYLCIEQAAEILGTLLAAFFPEPSDQAEECVPANGLGMPLRLTKFSLFSYKKNFICLFLKKEERNEKEGEKHQCVVTRQGPPTGGLTWPAVQACALTGNRTGDPLVHRPALNPLSHTRQG